MGKRGKLFVISGPAGAGKSEIVKKVLANHADVRVSVSCTTRAPRPGEVDGVSYHFVSQARFDELVAQNAFYEYAHVHQHSYGTLKSVVARELDAGNDLILEIDVQGCSQVLEHDRTAVGIFVSPPSCENLEARLRGRGTESEESVRVRLENVRCELEQAYHYDYVIIHQDWGVVPDALNIAAEEVYAIIRANRGDADAQRIADTCRESGRRDFLDSLTAELRTKAVKLEQEEEQ